LLKLTSFLETISGKNMKKWVDCISKLVQRRQSNEDASRDITFDFDRSPPEFEVHIEKPEPGWPELLTVSFNIKSLAIEAITRTLKKLYKAVQICFKIF
jgi:hypothetical protein